MSEEQERLSLYLRRKMEIRTHIFICGSKQDIRISAEERVFNDMELDRKKG